MGVPHDAQRCFYPFLYCIEHPLLLSRESQDGEIESIFVCLHAESIAKYLYLYSFLDTNISYKILLNKDFLVFLNKTTDYFYCQCVFAYTISQIVADTRNPLLGETGVRSSHAQVWYTRRRCQRWLRGSHPRWHHPHQVIGLGPSKS